MRVSTSPMTKRPAAALAAALLALSACSGKEDAPDAPVAKTTSTLQVNQQDEAKRNLAEATKPYSIGDAGDSAMGAPTPTAPTPLDDEVVGNSMENVQ